MTGQSLKSFILPKSDIQNVQTSPMLKGLLFNLTNQKIRDLFHYLKPDAQVPIEANQN
ncbi:MAG: hypothetical protein M2R45_00560 [Verrucomicrobia subdivision 3 bacterium]|nr:hypothetical protein [Limisphaerales bacterium]MCS1413562.1 hypothetical protein [Limisphaerales bacterium]